MTTYLIAIRWVHNPIRFGPPELVDGVVSQFDDWFRYGPMTWFVRTTATGAEISAAVRKAVHADDGVLVMAVDPVNIAGWAPPDVWRWLQAKRSEAAA